MAEPVEEFEGSTLDLIHRRRIRMPLPGLSALFMGICIIVALPLIKVDMVTTVGGMIRTIQEPLEVISPTSGIIRENFLRDFSHISAGDTLVILDDREAQVRLDNCRILLARNKEYIADIRNILCGRIPQASDLYKQSLRDHASRMDKLRVEVEYLRGDFTTADTLFSQEVIPASEYENSRTRYLEALAAMKNLEEDYYRQLEGTLRDLLSENLALKGEMEHAGSEIQNRYILAPIGGMVQLCTGMTSKSVIAAGSRLGTITPDGPLVAECYVEPAEIGQVRIGTEARIRLHRRYHWQMTELRARVTAIDAGAVTMGGHAVYRVRCLLTGGGLSGHPETGQSILPGMTFSANLLMGRTSLASLLSDKLFRWSDPYLARDQASKPAGNGS